MDDRSFDDLARVLTVGGTRRAALGLALGGLLAVLGLDAEGKKKGNGKRKGKGRGNGKGKGTGNDNGNGTSPPPSPSPPPDPCAGVACPTCFTCRGGACAEDPGNTPCFSDGSGRCRAGTCYGRPSCAPRGSGCGGSVPCCSGACSAPSPWIPGFGCLPGGEGQWCLSNDDCTINNCVGYRCQAA